MNYGDSFCKKKYFFHHITTNLVSLHLFSGTIFIYKMDCKLGENQRASIGCDALKVKVKFCIFIV